MLELASGNSWPLTTNGAVNLEPRFSPDGKRIAFVSTAFERRFHVFALDIEDGRPGAQTRLSEDRDSGLPRYYYSRFDQYLSPSWSPDGRELLVVSNRGRTSGSGRALPHARRAGGAAAPGPRRGDDLEGSARLGARRPARGLRLLSRPPVAPAPPGLGRRRRRLPPHVRRVRRDGAALLAGRHAHRLRVERGRRAVAVDDRPAGRRAPRAGDPRAPPPRGDRPAAGGRDRGRPLRAGAPLGHDGGRAQLRSRGRVAPRRRLLRPRRAPHRARLLPLERRRRARGACRHRHARGHARPRVPAGAPHARRPGRRHAQRRHRTRADRRLAGARLVERRPARPHELRGRLPRDARDAARHGGGRGPARGLQPDRQQGRADPGHRAGSRAGRTRARRAARCCATTRSSTPAGGGTCRCSACAATCSCPTTPATPARGLRAFTRRTRAWPTWPAPRARSSGTCTRSTTRPTPRARAT